MRTPTPEDMLTRAKAQWEALQRKVGVKVTGNRRPPGYRNRSGGRPAVRRRDGHDLARQQAAVAKRERRAARNMWRPMLDAPAPPPTKPKRTRKKAS